MTAHRPGGPVGRSLRERLLSTANHPRNIITDPDRLTRYQLKRLAIAVVGGLLGGLGFGLTYSHAGLVGAGFAVAALLPMLIGVVVAAAFVWYPFPEILRWVAVLGLVVVGIALMDMGLEWQIGLGVIGLVASFVIAAALQYVLGVVRITARNLPRHLVGLALLGLLAVSAPSPSAAQGDGPPACPAGRLELSIDGRAGVFTAGGQGPPLVIRIDGDVTRIPVVASSDLARGTVVVELIEVEPVPFVPERDVVIWTGDLRPLPGGAGGRTELQDVRIFRTAGSGLLEVVVGAHGTNLGLVAGQGHYRATFHDPVDGTTCRLDGVLRVTASPLDTMPGRIGVGGAVSGLALTLGSAMTRVSKPGADAGSGAGAPAGRTSPPPPRPLVLGRRPSFTLRRQSYHPPSSLLPGPEYELFLQVRIEEDDSNVYEVETRNVSLLEMIDVRLVGGLSGGGDWEVPIEIRTDPKRIAGRLASFEVAVVPRGGKPPVSVASFELLRPGQWSMETVGGETEIDLRTTSDLSPPFVPRVTEPDDGSADRDGPDGSGGPGRGGSRSGGTS